MSEVATCIGCGCDDEHACELNEVEPCSWLRTDDEMRLGVCSACPNHVARWDAGDFSMSSVARIGEEDDDSDLILPGDDDFDETMEFLE